MLRHGKLTLWEEKLKKVFDEIDDYLEEEYGRLYPLHPSRAGRGSTANKEQDGLFNVGANFSAGFGSEHGAGYVIEVRFATLERVDKDIRDQVEEDVVELLNRKLNKAFPEKALMVARDGGVYKIHGDLGLGAV